MKFWTIVTSGYPLAEIRHRLAEWGWSTLAHHLPRRLAYWSFIDTGVRTIRSDEVVPAVRYTDLLKRAEK